MALLTSYWGLDLIILFLSAIVGAYFYMTRKFNYWKERGVMEFPPTPFIGNFADCAMLRRSPGEFLRDLYEKSKDLKYMGFYIFDIPSLLIRDPELIRHVLVKDFNHFVDRFQELPEADQMGRGNLFSMTSNNWKFLRNKLSPLFTSMKIKKMFEMIKLVAKDLDTHMESLGLEGEGRVIELKDTCAKFTTANIAMTSFGLHVNSLNKPDDEFRECGRDMFNFTYKRGVEVGFAFFRPGLNKLCGFKIFPEKSCNFLRKVFWETVNERIASGIKRDDLLETLMDLKRSQEIRNDTNEFKFEGDNLVAQAVIFFFAGLESTSTTMSFALYELALHPDIQNRLRDEMRTAIEQNSGELTYEMVMTLPYLNMVVSETMRKYPALPLLNRVAIADYNVPGTELVIEKGTPVYIPIYGLHFDPKFHPDPDKFDPERFSNENKHEMTPFTYMPFGEGPRNCIGLRLGHLQVKLGLIHIISQYEITTCKDTQIPVRYNHNGVTLTSEGGLFLNVRKISSSSE